MISFRAGGGGGKGILILWSSMPLKLHSEKIEPLSRSLARSKELKILLYRSLSLSLFFLTQRDFRKDLIQ